MANDPAPAFPPVDDMPLAHDDGTPFARLTQAEFEELMADSPAPGLPTDEEIDAMYAEHLAREAARDAAGHKDHHYWAA